MRYATTGLAVLLSASMVGCATTTTTTSVRGFDTSRPLQLDGGNIRQDDQPLLLNDLELKLAAHPIAGQHMGGYGALKWTGLLLGGVGGGLVGWNLGDNLVNGTSDWTPALIGAGAIALSVPFGLLAGGQLRSAAEAYNGSFTQSLSKVPVNAVPFFAVVPKREGGNQCLAGVTMSF